MCSDLRKHPCSQWKNRAKVLFFFYKSVRYNLNESSLTSWPRESQIQFEIFRVYFTFLCITPSQNSPSLLEPLFGNLTDQFGRPSERPVYHQWVFGCGIYQLNRRRYSMCLFSFHLTRNLGLTYCPGRRHFLLGTIAVE